jgi:hypothetical protein
MALAFWPWLLAYGFGAICDNIAATKHEKAGSPKRAACLALQAQAWLSCLSLRLGSRKPKLFFFRKNL